MGVIPRPAHAVIDYLWGGLHYFAPELFDFQKEEAATAFSRFRGGSAVATALVTRYELGVIKLIPYNLHLLFDLIGALLGMASPWLLGFEKNEKARTAALRFSLAELGVVLMSKRDS